MALVRRWFWMGENDGMTADEAVQAYRDGRLTEAQLAGTLGIDRFALDGFLKARGVYLEYTDAELAEEVALGDELWRKREGNN